MIAFIKKEIMEHTRTGKLIILGSIFLFIGILNPLMAKLTPKLFEMMADELKESGIVATAVDPTALDSWTQFYKNISMALIAFVMVEAGIFTKEYSSGTLVITLTKGLSRTKVYISKALMLIGLWTLCFWMCFGVTYGYSAYYWDNSIVHHIFGAALLWWIFGLWIMAMMLLFSAMSSSISGVLLGTGGLVIVTIILSALPKIKDYAPSVLMSGAEMIKGNGSPADHATVLVYVIIMSIAFVIGGIVIFRKRAL